ncbi:MAG: lysK [Rickettsiales bacterium]|jgi:lysyl-tRNA synthetase class 1|nr:lysK [Rickettsiales bacterium]
MSNLRETALLSTAWPFVEAKKILERIEGKTPKKGYVLFETGYGPSGLPHIGTFGEVARTQMVRKAFEAMSDIPTKLICISDDMDGLRKVPENLPNTEMLAKYIAKPLTSVPDPFGTHESYGHHMNARLRAFLDHYGFDYEFKSSTECYKNGEFDEKLLALLKRYDDVMKVMLPTLGAERQATYSPFLPISPKTGNVLYVPVVPNVAKGTISFADEDGTPTELPVTGGHCKLQWKPDLGMRWAAFDVDFEMYGKDHLASAPLYTKICEIAGGKAPEQFKYELFLDEKGEKISKSKGNGITIDEWLRYAPTESLSLYMYQSPNKAKRLYFDVIPRQMDDYLTFLQKYPEQDDATKLANPVWHIHQGKPPISQLSGLSFSLLLNLASACNPEDPSVLWGFISRYAPGVTEEKDVILKDMVKHALVYYHDFIKPNKQYRAPSNEEREALIALAEALKAVPAGSSAEEIQNVVYAVGRDRFADQKLWFQALYEVLLGASQGPRFGSFIALYGIKETLGLIGKALEGKDLAA